MFRINRKTTINKEKGCFSMMLKTGLALALSTSLLGTGVVGTQEESVPHISVQRDNATVTTTGALNSNSHVMVVTQKPGILLEDLISEFNFKREGKREYKSNGFLSNTKQLMGYKPGESVEWSTIVSNNRYTHIYGDPKASNTIGNKTYSTNKDKGYRLSKKYANKTLLPSNFDKGLAYNIIKGKKSLVTTKVEGSDIRFSKGVLYNGTKKFNGSIYTTSKETKEYETYQVKTSTDVYKEYVKHYNFILKQVKANKVKEYSFKNGRLSNVRQAKNKIDESNDLVLQLL